MIHTLALVKFLQQTPHGNDAILSSSWESREMTSKVFGKFCLCTLFIWSCTLQCLIRTKSISHLQWSLGFCTVTTFYYRTEQMMSILPNFLGRHKFCCFVQQLHITVMSICLGARKMSATAPAVPVRTCVYTSTVLITRIMHHAVKGFIRDLSSSPNVPNHYPSLRTFSFPTRHVYAVLGVRVQYQLCTTWTLVIRKGVL